MRRNAHQPAGIAARERTRKCQVRTDSAETRRGPARRRPPNRACDSGRSALRRGCRWLADSVGRSWGGHQPAGHVGAVSGHGRQVSHDRSQDDQRRDENKLRRLERQQIHRDADVLDDNRADQGDDAVAEEQPNAPPPSERRIDSKRITAMIVPRLAPNARMIEISCRRSLIEL